MLTTLWRFIFEEFDEKKLVSYQKQKKLIFHLGKQKILFFVCVKIEFHSLIHIPPSPYTVILFSSMKISSEAPCSRSMHFSRAWTSTLTSDTWTSSSRTPGWRRTPTITSTSITRHSGLASINTTRGRRSSHRRQVWTGWCEVRCFQILNAILVFQDIATIESSCSDLIALLYPS